MIIIQNNNIHFSNYMYHMTGEIYVGRKFSEL